MQTDIRDSLSLLHNSILNISNFSFSLKESDSWNLKMASIKSSEELGELSESVLVLSGNMPHKTLGEHPFGEVSDNINQIFDVSSFCLNSDPIITYEMVYNSVVSTFELLKDKDMDFLSDFCVNKFIEFRSFHNLMNSDFDETYLYSSLSEVLSLSVSLYLLSSKDNENSINDFCYLLNDHLVKKLAKWKSIQVN